MRTITLFTSATAVFLLGLGQALAAPLLPGDSIGLSGVTFIDSVHGGTTPVVNDGLIEFRIDPTPTTFFTDTGGNVQNRVTSNGAGTLNFMPRIRDTFNIDGGTFGIVGFEVDGFGGFSTDVAFRTDGSGTKGPSSAERSPSGDILTFSYDDPLLIDALNPPGRKEESLFPSIVTDATHFENTGSMTIFGRLYDASSGGTPDPIGSIFSVTITGIAVPTVSTVPLPASGLLLLGGLAGLIGMRRRKG